DVPGIPLLSTVLRESIDAGLAHRDEALAYARGFARGLDTALADQFVSMYVNEMTRGYGEEGRQAVEELLRRAQAAGVYQDVRFGAANQAGEDNRNVARMAALLAGLPESVAGVTVNRLCASGLSAVVAACHAVVAGDGDLFVAGGVESMSRAPLVLAKPEHP